MSGWDRMEADWWESVVDGLLASGQPWPAGARLMDLRTIQRECLFGRRRSWPSKRELAKRWGCGASTALRVVREEEWQDPARAEQWAKWCSEHGVDHLRTTREPPVDHPAKEEPTESVNGGPPADQARTTRGHRRVGDTQNPKGSSLSLSAQEAIRLWMELQTGLPDPRPTAEEELKLEALIGELGRDQVLDVIRWWWSGHDQACWLRSQGLGWSTLLKPDKARKYLQRAREPAPQPQPKRRARRGGSTRSQVERIPRHQPRSSPDEQAAEAEARAAALGHLLEELRAGQHPDQALLWFGVLDGQGPLHDLEAEQLDLVLQHFRLMTDELVAMDWPEHHVSRFQAAGDQVEAAAQESRRRSLRVVKGGAE